MLGKPRQDGLRASESSTEGGSQVALHSLLAREKHTEDQGEETPALLERAGRGPLVVIGDLSKQLAVEFVTEGRMAETGGREELCRCDVTL